MKYYHNWIEIQQVTYFIFDVYINAITIRWKTNTFNRRIHLARSQNHQFQSYLRCKILSMVRVGAQHMQRSLQPSKSCEFLSTCGMSANLSWSLPYCECDYIMELTSLVTWQMYFISSYSNILNVSHVLPLITFVIFKDLSSRITKEYSLLLRR